MWVAGTVALWLLAIFGALCILALLGLSGVSTVEKPPEVAPPPPKPQPQITNLRQVPTPAPVSDQPQVLQKTTMSITTTKYVDPTRKEIEPSK